LPDGLHVWELLRRLLLEHDDEAHDSEAQVAFAYPRR
jgi:hypothetical protein